MQPPGDRRAKAVIAALMIGILAMTLILLQQQFDEGDYKYALEMLGNKRPGEAWSLGQELLQRSGGQTPQCAAKIVSSFRGTLEVTCVTPAGAHYRFTVDRVRKTIGPGDAETAALFEAVRRKNLSESDAGLHRFDEPE